MIPFGVAYSLVIVVNCTTLVALMIWDEKYPCYIIFITNIEKDIFLCVSVCVSVCRCMCMCTCVQQLDIRNVVI